MIVTVGDASFCLKSDTPAILKRNANGNLYLVEAKSHETWEPTENEKENFEFKYGTDSNVLVKHLSGSLNAAVKGTVDAKMKEWTAKGIHIL